MNNSILNQLKDKNKLTPNDEFYTPARTVKMIMDPLLTYCKHYGVLDDYLFVMCADDESSEFVIYAKEYNLNYVCFLDFLNWRDHIPPNNNKHIIIVTNPPFSLLSKWEVPKDVDYALILPVSALAYKNLKEATLNNYIYRLPGKFKNGKNVGVMLTSTIPLALKQNPPRKPNWHKCALLNGTTFIAPLSGVPGFKGGKLIEIHNGGFMINGHRTFSRAVYSITLHLPSVNVKKFYNNILKCYIITLLTIKGDFKNMDQIQNQPVQPIQNQPVQPIQNQPVQPIQTQAQPVNDQRFTHGMENVHKYSGMQLQHLQGYQYKIIGLNQNKYTYFKVTTNDMPRMWTTTTKNGKKISKYIFDNGVVTGLQSTFFIPTGLVYFDGTVNYIIAVEKNNNFNFPILRELSTLALQNKNVSINVLGSIIYK